MKKLVLKQNPIFDFTFIVKWHGNYNVTMGRALFTVSEIFL